MASLTACKPRMLKRGHQEHAHQQPEHDGADDRRHVALHAHAMHRVGQTALIGGVLQAELLGQGGNRLADEAGYDIAQHDHHDHGHDLRRDRDGLRPGVFKALAHGVPRIARRDGYGFGGLSGHVAGALAALSTVSATAGSAKASKFMPNRSDVPFEKRVCGLLDGTRRQFRRSVVFVRVHPGPFLPRRPEVRRRLVNLSAFQIKGGV